MPTPTVLARVPTSRPRPAPARPAVHAALPLLLILAVGCGSPAASSPDGAVEVAIDASIADPSIADASIETPIEGPVYLRCFCEPGGLGGEQCAAVDCTTGAGVAEACGCVEGLDSVECSAADPRCDAPVLEGPDTIECTCMDDSVQRSCAELTCFSTGQRADLCGELCDGHGGPRSDTCAEFTEECMAPGPNWLLCACDGGEQIEICSEFGCGGSTADAICRARCAPNFASGMACGGGVCPAP